MRETDINPSIFWALAPGGHKFPSQASFKRAELTPQLQKCTHILGPTPKRCLETLTDLGMSDIEIGQYFAVPSRCVTDLRQIWNIGEITRHS